MGDFASSALNLLLGWVRSAVRWLWQLMNGQQGGGFVAWLGEHWVLTAVIICLAGIGVDLIVYMFRWRPDLVWRSFFRRLMQDRPQLRQSVENQPKLREWVEQEEQPQEAAPETPTEPAVYADDQPEQPQERHRRADKHKKRRAILSMLTGDDDDAQIKPYKPTLPKGAKPAAMNDTYYPPQWQRPEDAPGSRQQR